ncbi:hypothetical protein [Flavobacterium sp.]
MSKEIKKSENFQFHGNTTFPLAGTSTVYSNENLTDEIAIEILSKNPNRKVLFSKMPKNVDELIYNFKSATSDDTGAGAKVVKLDADSVKIGEGSYTVEQAIALLEKVNVSTKATTVKGVENVITKLDEKVKAELVRLAADVKDPVNVDTGAGAKTRTKDQIEFDLEKAEQELKDLEEADTPDDEAIENAKIEVQGFKDELENLA